MAETAAARIGVTFPMVPSGVAAYPVMSAGASGVPRGRTQAVTEGTYSVTVVEAKPTRLSVYGIYSIEDELRLPGLAEAIIVSKDSDFGPAVELAKAIAKSQGRELVFQSAFPVAPNTPKKKRRGVPGTQWVPIDRATYDACRDWNEYRPPKR